MEIGVSRSEEISQFEPLTYAKGYLMNNIVYIVGAVVIVIAVLSFLGLR